MGLLDTVRGTLTPDIMRGASSLIGEDPTATQKAFSGAVPTLLAGTVNQASTEAGADRLRATIVDGGFGEDMLTRFSGMLGGGGSTDELLRSGGTLLSGLFGARLDGVTDAVAGHAGIKRGSASTLLRFAAPLIMSVIGKQIASKKLDGRGLMSWLSGERSSIMSALPPGMATVLGFDELRTGPSVTTRTIEREPATTRTIEREPVTRRVERKSEIHVHEKPRRRWGPALIGALAALGLLYFLGRGREPERVRVDVPPALEQPAAPMVPSVPEVRREGYLREIENFLRDRTLREKKFVLVGLNFESGSALLTAQGQNAVNELAAVVKAHPNAKLRIEGHTDNQGSAAANRKLSRERAQAVQKALVARGVPAANITIKGVGPDKPVASNDNESGRAQNRRTELIIIKQQ